MFTFPLQALMVLSLVQEYHNTEYLGDIVSAQDIVHVANNIFLSDQVCNNKMCVMFVDS